MKEQSKADKIKKERLKLIKVYSNLSDKEKKINAKMIDNAAFMAITLEELQETINEKGCVEKYQNGAKQFGLKKSSEVEVYNVMIKNYKAIIDSLNALLPKKEVTKDDGFDDFITEREE